MASRTESYILNDIDERLQTAGAAGCGGAGFPSYPKWEDLDDIDHLLINHQESEPVFYSDKYLLKAYAEEFASFFDALLEQTLDTVVIGAKAKDRDEWMQEVEAATDATVYQPGDLPFDADEETGVVVAYTQDRFQYGMETSLLALTTDTKIGQDIPTDHGWLVHNTETLYNIYRTLVDDAPVTHKYVHVDGDVPQHRFLRVPVGTPASTLLEAAGSSLEEIGDDQVFVEGGPGWGFEMDDDPAEFGVRKRSNGIMVLDADLVEEHTYGGGRVNLLDPIDWYGHPHETEPVPIHPERVRVPLITNTDYEGLVAPSMPVVDTSDHVSAGDVVAAPTDDGVSIAQHASIPGTVTEITEQYIEIQRT